MIIFALIGVLTTGGVFLVQQRSMVRIVFGLSLLSHAANLVLLSAGVAAWRGEPLADRTAAEAAADPLPQAFVLTAVVISMATSTILLTMAAMGKNDDTDVVEPVDDNTIDHAFSTLGRDAQNRQILEESTNQLDRIGQVDHNTPVAERGATEQKEDDK